MDCATCRVRVRTEWFDLDGKDLECLDGAKARRHYAPGEYVFKAEEPCRGLYYVALGLISNLRRYDRGKAENGLLTFRHPGDVLGLRSFLSDSPHLATAKAVQPSVVCFIDGETVQALIGRNPNTMLQFLRRLAGNLECAEEQLAHPGADGVRRRVVRLLAGLRLAYARPEAGGETTLDLPLPPSDLAAAVGATPRAVAAALRRLQAEGIVAAEANGLRILDPDRLRTAVRDDPPLGRA